MVPFDFRLIPLRAFALCKQLLARAHFLKITTKMRQASAPFMPVRTSHIFTIGVNNQEGNKRKEQVIRPERLIFSRRNRCPVLSRNPG